MKKWFRKLATLLGFVLLFLLAAKVILHLLSYIARRADKSAAPVVRDRVMKFRDIFEQLALLGRSAPAYADFAQSYRSGTRDPYTSAVVSQVHRAAQA